MFFENHRFSRFFCKRSNKIQGSTMHTWPLRKQPSFSWMLLVRLQKSWRICCFQKPLWLDNLLPSEPHSSSRNVTLARTIAKLSTRTQVSGYFGKRGFFFPPFSKKEKIASTRGTEIRIVFVCPTIENAKTLELPQQPLRSMRHAISIWRTVNIRI